MDDSGADADAASDAEIKDSTGDVADAISADTGSTSCISGTIEEGPCGKCGTRSRLCDKSKWLDWSSCSGETGACAPGDTREVSCERCGKRTETCSMTCTWGGGVCTEQKACVAGTTETRYSCVPDAGSDASSDAGVQTRTCTDVCTWTEWSACP